MEHLSSNELNDFRLSFNNYIKRCESYQKEGPEKYNDFIRSFDGVFVYFLNVLKLYNVNYDSCISKSLLYGAELCSLKKKSYLKPVFPFDTFGEQYFLPPSRINLGKSILYFAFWANDDKPVPNLSKIILDVCNILEESKIIFEFSTVMMDILAKEKSDIALDAIEIVLSQRNYNLPSDTAYRLVFILERFISTSSKARQIVSDNLDHPSDGLRHEMHNLSASF